MDLGSNLAEACKRTAEKGGKQWFAGSGFNLTAQGWGSYLPHASGAEARMAPDIEEVEPLRDVGSHVIPKVFAASGLSETEVGKIICFNPTRLLEPDEAV